LKKKKLKNGDVNMYNWKLYNVTKEQLEDMEDL